MSPGEGGALPPKTPEQRQADQEIAAAIFKSRQKEIQAQRGVPGQELKAAPERPRSVEPVEGGPPGAFRLADPELIFVSTQLNELDSAISDIFTKLMEASNKREFLKLMFDRMVQKRATEEMQRAIPEKPIVPLEQPAGLHEALGSSDEPSGRNLHTGESAPVVPADSGVGEPEAI